MRAQCVKISAILDPPYFSLDTTFKSMCNPTNHDHCYLLYFTAQGYTFP